MDESTRRVFVVKAALLAVAIASPTLAGDWPGWRGPEPRRRLDRDGAPQQWGPAGPPLAWKASGWDRASRRRGRRRAPLHAGGQDGAQYVFAFEAGGGAPLWKVRVGPLCGSTVRGAHDPDGRRRPRLRPRDERRPVPRRGHGKGRVEQEPRARLRRAMMSSGSGASRRSSTAIAWCSPPGPRTPPSWRSRRRRARTSGARRSRARPEGPGRGRLLVERDLERGRGEAVRPAPRPRPRRRPRHRREVPLGLQPASRNGVANISTPLVRANWVFASTGYQTGAALVELSRPATASPRARSTSSTRRRSRTTTAASSSSATTSTPATATTRASRSASSSPPARSPGAATSATRAAARRRWRTPTGASTSATRTASWSWSRRPPTATARRARSRSRRWRSPSWAHPVDRRRPALPARAGQPLLLRHPAGEVRLVGEELIPR